MRKYSILSIHLSSTTESTLVDLLESTDRSLQLDYRPERLKFEPESTVCQTGIHFTDTLTDN